MQIKSKEDAKQAATNYFIVSVIVVFFMLHITLIKSALGFFTCTYIDDDHSFLNADMGIECWVGSHQTWSMGLGAVMLIGYGLGIPLLAFVTVRRIRFDLEKWRETYGFLYSSYHPETWYWEIVIVLRKSMFAFATVLLRPLGVDIQVNFGVLVIVFAMYLQLVTQPYNHSIMNYLETYALLTEFVTLSLGIFLFSDNVTSDFMRILISTLIVGTNIAYLLCV